MDQKKVLVPCLKARNVDLAQNRENNIYQKYSEVRLRAPIFVKPLEGFRVLNVGKLFFSVTDK
jgi:hypothetical protein